MGGKREKRGLSKRISHSRKVRDLKEKKYARSKKKVNVSRKINRGKRGNARLIENKTEKFHESWEKNRAPWSSHRTTSTSKKEEVKRDPSKGKPAKQKAS